MTPLPRRISALFLVSCLGLASAVLTGCPGDLDPRLMGGGGGTGGQQVCDGAALMVTKCSQPGCHSDSSPQGGLDLKSAGVAARLKAAPPAGMNPSCTDDLRTAYFGPASDVSSGFLFKKLMTPPPCGSPMPELGTWTTTDATCLQDWATAVVNGQIQ
jgi:hypothetical protein